MKRATITIDWRTEQWPAEAVRFAAGRCESCLHGWAHQSTVLTAANDGYPAGDVRTLMASCYLQALEDVLHALEAKGVDLSALDGLAALHNQKECP